MTGYTAEVIVLGDSPTIRIRNAYGHHLGYVQRIEDATDNGLTIDPADVTILGATS